MENVIRAFLGLFFLTVLVTGALSFTIASSEERNADLYAAEVAEEIRNSDGSEEEIRRIRKEAEKRGYVLTTEEGEVCLTYPHHLLFFDLEKEKTARAAL